MFQKKKHVNQDQVVHDHQVLNIKTNRKKKKHQVHIIPHVYTSPLSVNTSVCWFPQATAITLSGIDIGCGPEYLSDIVRPNCLSSLLPNRYNWPSTLIKAVW